jgi:hypothetical protein
MAGFAKTIQINLRGIKAAKLQESFVEIHSATKIRILSFYPLIGGYSQEKENRQSEKPHSALKVSRKELRLCDRLKKARSSCF